MPISDADSRKLPFPLINSLSIVGFSPDDGQQPISLNDLFPDETTKIKLEFELSLDEYVALASAIDVGRDIAYGEDSEFLWWVWVACVKGLAMDCDGVADCIENSAAVQAAIANLLNSLGYGTNTGLDAQPP